MLLQLHFLLLLSLKCLSLCRNYIFAHTTTKIDSRLGSELFSHLVFLPMTYFKNRKAGNIVARIRDFIADKLQYCLIFYLLL
ncbi:ABC transporter transmembrane domain-containing protein [Campylobacter pinnipediorum]|uniref:ABC transporter transmembrane domain-containing protein n=1 Tax=Campylobacter pinnipediorum TaxID=1965231 RepID=UPI000D72F0FC|nr:ABC transporter transmembrane domain-containing protein [Campylobacter pinnipediorum]